MRYLGACYRRTYVARFGWGGHHAVRNATVLGAKPDDRFEDLLTLHSLWADRSAAMKTSLLLFLLPFSVAVGQPTAASRLEDSSRHREWVKIKSGQRELSCFVTYPEVKDRAPAVLVIHEIFGLTDWVRGVTDQLAEHGYIAIVPDLLSGVAPDGGGTGGFANVDAVIKAVSSLPADQVTGDLQAVAAYLRGLAACNGRVSVAGFCWGGGQAFRYATNSPDLRAAFVFYGPAPAEVASIGCPVYGFYGGNDARISATVPATTERMRAAGKHYEPVIYEGAGHGFMREGEKANASTANRQAQAAGWQRWLDLLAKANAG